MLRTASQGADVREDEAGNEWEVVEPHGTGKGQGRTSEWDESVTSLRRRHSQADIKAYEHTIIEELYVYPRPSVCDEG